MSKSKLIIGGIFVLTLSIVIWSCKDKFTEEDQMKLQAQLQANQEDKNSKDSIALSIQVYNASVTAGTAGGRVSSTKGLSGIDVKLTYNGKTETKASDESGIVSFFVKPGSVSGTISKTGYATVNFTLTANRPDNTLEHLTNASVTLPVFATSGATVSTVKGNVTYEGDLLNNTRENVPDGKVKITFSPTQASLESYYSSTVNTVNADVDKYSIESAFTASVTSGKFSIDLPAGAGDAGLIYNYQFGEFEADQRIAINAFENNPNNSSVKRDVTTIPTQFSTITFPNTSFTAVPAVSPIRIEIAPPPAAGTGASASLKLKATTVSDFFFTGIAVGSGYPASANNIPVTVIGGDFDNSVPGATPAVLFASSNSAGQITGIQTTGGAGGTLGFGYRGQATLSIGGGGSGALYRVNYLSVIAPMFGTGVNSGSSLTSGGTGYTQAPTVFVRGVDFNGDFLEESHVTDIANGSVVSFPTGNTPLFSKINSVTFRPVERANAIVSSSVLVNNLGEITPNGSGVTNSGRGYDESNPPTVSVKDLREASPTAAVWVAIMDFNGGVQSLAVVNRGSGYSTQTNANFPIVATSFVANGLASGSQLRPGVTYTLNGYYGTGIKSQGVQ
jgi:hypothetical protein